MISCGPLGSGDTLPTHVTHVRKTIRHGGFSVILLDCGT